jgi:hypothetical protein
MQHALPPFLDHLHVLPHCIVWTTRLLWVIGLSRPAILTVRTEYLPCASAAQMGIRLRTALVVVCPR